MDFSLSLAKGFHNAPKLYGDDTVRKSEPVTDLRSGIMAATKEFGYGMYDGITGLVTQPMKGAQKEGTAGFFKGIGKGLGGVWLKPGAAIFGIPGYTMKGIHRELQKQFGSSVQDYIIAARTAQGYDEWQQTSPEERKDVVQRWQAIQKDLKKKRNPDEMVRDILEDQRRKKQEMMANWKSDKTIRRLSRSRAASTGEVARTTDSPGSHDSESATLQAEAQDAALGRAQTSTNAQIEDDHELQEAIRLSVRETSRGNPEEDAAVERALQASMAELQRNRNARLGADLEEEQLRQAIAASHAEAAQGHADIADDEELKRVLAQSLKEQRRQRGSDSEWDSEPDTDNDEAYQRAIGESQRSAQSHPDEPPPA